MNFYPLEGNLITGEVDWSKSAIAYDNTRLISGVLQINQLLCTVANEYGYKTRYKSYGINHPNRIWAGESRNNFTNLLALDNALLCEYSIRFHKEHKCLSVYEDLRRLSKVLPFPKEEATHLDPSVPFKYFSTNVIVATRSYWLSKETMRYPKNRIPDWFAKGRKIPYEVVL